MIDMFMAEQVRAHGKQYRWAMRTRLDTLAAPVHVIRVQGEGKRKAEHREPS